MSENSGKRQEITRKVPKLALVIAPFTDQNLLRAAQIGVTDIVIKYPGDDLREITLICSQVESYGMKVSVIERHLPFEDVKIASPKRDEQIELLINLIKNMAAAKIPILCWNFMAGGDWSRTSFYQTDRKCRVSAFDAEYYKNAVIPEEKKITKEQIWENLDYVMKRILPVAEEYNIKLAMHPDDPPLEEVLGMARILNSVEAFEKLLEKYPSPANGICFGAGTFAEMGINVPEALRRLAKTGRVYFSHFRDVKGSVPKFQETWQDTGMTDMFELMKVHVELGLDIPVRPDHVPLLAGEENDPSNEPNGGYTMLGRLFAIGYMKGLIEGACKVLEKEK